MPRLDDPTLIVSDAAAFRDWLDANKDSSGGVWLRSLPRRTQLTRPVSPMPRPWSRPCVRDGSTGRSGAATPRHSRNVHSQTPHKPVVEAQRRHCRGADRGRADAAAIPGLWRLSEPRPTGRWAAAYSGQAAATVPADLARALAANAAAGRMFTSLNGANRYAVLYRIETAKRADTRARRIDQFVVMLARGETIHTQQPP